MIKNLKKLLPLAGTFLVLITLFCCDSTLIEDLDAIARKQTEGTYIYQTIIQKQHIDDNNYDKDTATETLNQPKTSTELKQWISDAKNKNSTTGFILSNTPEVEHPEDNLYRLELIYDRELYTLDFNENTTSIYEGSIPQSQTQRYEKLITLEFPELKQTNYMFLGWDENNTAVSPVYTTDKREFTFYKDTTLYAIWQALINYTIRYIVNGTEITFDGYTSTYTVESETIPLPEPSVVGYTFEGWYTDPEFADGTKVEQIPHGSTGNFTLYAKMTETSSGIAYTTPDVSFIKATIYPGDDTFDTTTISDTGIKFKVDTDTLISSEQMTPSLTCQWYLDGELKPTDSTDSTDTLNISYDSLAVGSHILTVIITDSTGIIATGTKQFVVIKE